MYGNSLVFTTCLFHLVNTQIPANFSQPVSKRPLQNFFQKPFLYGNGNIESIIGHVWSNDVINCIDDEDVGKCIQDALDKSVTELKMLEKLNQLANVTTDTRGSYGGSREMEKLLGNLAEKIQKKINDEVEDFQLRDADDLNKNFTVGVAASRNETRNFQLIVKSFDGRSVTERKKKFDMGNVLYYLLIPALAMAGMMPWILPPIKMVAMAIMAINQMAFSMGAFSLIRGLIFDPEPQEHIIYINNGYRKQHFQKSTNPKYEIKDRNE